MPPDNKILSLAIVLLRDVIAPTKAQITAAAKDAMRMLTPAERKAVDVPMLVRELESRCNIDMGSSSVLHGKDPHEPWLPERTNKIEWLCWEHYREYLTHDRNQPLKVVKKQGEDADTILADLEDPERPGSWDRRGLVVGNVQSGKTGNYTALICKAADAGYKFIVVLAGLHKSLRSQTQERIDEGFIGRDTSRLIGTVIGGQAIGVGKIRQGKMRSVGTYTLASDDGDFKKAIAASAGIPLGDMPIVVVVKKNQPILENLLTWLQDNQAAVYDPILKKRVIRDIPALIIDDEADNASVNTKAAVRDEFGNVDKETDPSAINGMIREILSTFRKVAYVGYTATPYANIFIYPRDNNPRVGEDIYPRSFIRNLHAPDNYVGPQKVFGLGDQGDGGEGAELPLLRELCEEDYSGFVPDKHRKEHRPTELPASLKEAIQFFVLSAAGRSARGQSTEHNSMLIHVTRYTAVQKCIHDLVKEFTDQVALSLKYSEKDAIWVQLRSLWEAEFTPKQAAIAGAVSDSALTPLTWSQIKPFIRPVIEKIKVKSINGTVADILDYRLHRKDGANVIAIGGDKLSRGLTLEGLSVSYYLRATRMYDTLMQMGRWFGYRPGYLDLCRIYTSSELIEWYIETSIAYEELRREFDNMAAVGGTPEDYGLKVRTSKLGLKITAANKIRDGVELKLSFSTDIAEQYAFMKDPQWIETNFSAADKLIRAIGPKQFKKDGSAHIAAGVGAQNILTFLSGLGECHRCLVASPKKVREFIEKQLPQGHLVDWTVAILSGEGPQKSLFGLDVKLVHRKDTLKGGTTYYVLPQRRLITPSHEGLDLTEEVLRSLPRAGKGKDPNPHALRMKRDPSKALLLLYPLDPKYAAKEGGKVFSTSPIMGYAISFPKVPNALEVGYTVNNTYYRQEMGDPA